MVFRFALAAEYRDEATGMHLVRIADYCTEIAKSMRLSKKDIYYIRYASPMHDIGKIGIPDVILKKKGKLTPAQRKIIKTHTEVGAQIFKGTNSPLLKAAGLISLTHHERFDGTGYPKGLKGKKIPLYGRIVALADTFDALISKRSYKKAYDFDKAIEMIKERAGNHFDPDIVKAFLKRKKRIKKIWQATKDIDLFISERKADI